MLPNRISTAFATFLSCLIALLCLSSCASGPDVKADTAPKPAPGFLADIPAEPYWAVASLEPLPEEMVDSGLAAAHGWATMNGIAASDAGDESVLGRLSTRMTAADLDAEFGISRSPHVAFYSVGTVPVLRVELTDSEAFRAALESLEEEAGIEVSVETHAEQSFRRYRTLLHPRGYPELLLHIGEDEVVLTTPRGGQVEVLIPYLVGERELESTMADGGGGLQELKENYELSPYLVGFFDSAKLVDVIAQRSDATGLQAEVEQAYELDIQRDEAWEREMAELTTLTDAFPRLVGGLGQFDEDTFEIAFGVEADPDIIAAVNETRSGFIGWKTAPYQNATISAGVGVHIGRFLDLSTHEATESIMGPFESWDMRDWNAIVQSFKRAAATAPMAMRQLSGLGAIVNLEEIDLSAAAQPRPTSRVVINGMLGAGHKEPASLLAALQEIAPHVVPKQINDGPTALPGLAQMSPFLVEPYLYTTDAHLAVTTGGRQDERVETVFGAGAADAPLAQMRVDFGHPAREINKALVERLAAIESTRGAYPGISDAEMAEARKGLGRLEAEAPAEDEPSQLMLTVDTREDAVFTTYRYQGPSLGETDDFQETTESIETLFEVTSTPPRQ